MSPIRTDIQRRFNDLREFPAFPLRAQEILRAERDARSSATTLQKIIEKDPALATNVIKLCNSAYFGVANRVTNLRQALALLGFNTIRSMVLNLEVLSMFGGTTGGFNIRAFWERSLATATLSRLICRKVDEQQMEDAYLAGLVADLGLLGLVVFFPKEYRELRSLIDEGNSHELAEETVLGGSTAEFAGLMLDRWRFPPLLKDAVIWHADPDKLSLRSVLADVVWTAKDAVNDVVGVEGEKDVLSLPLKPSGASDRLGENITAEIAELCQLMLVEMDKQRAFLQFV